MNSIFAVFLLKIIEEHTSSWRTDSVPGFHLLPCNFKEKATDQHQALVPQEPAPHSRIYSGCRVLVLPVGALEVSSPLRMFQSVNMGKSCILTSNPRPERGSFPLDHDAECKHLISSYLRCLKSQDPPGKNNEECRLLAKGYLACRMEKGLMAKDEWPNLGLNFDKAQTGAETAAQKGPG
jgi:cytochrome c oxidase assembly protein subunit 19